MKKVPAQKTKSRYHFIYMRVCGNKLYRSQQQGNWKKNKKMKTLTNYTY